MAIIATDPNYTLITESAYTSTHTMVGSDRNPPWYIRHWLASGVPTQTAIAAALGLAQPNISAWKAGRRPVPAARLPDLLSVLHFGAVAERGASSLIAQVHVDAGVSWLLHRKPRVGNRLVVVPPEHVGWFVDALRTRGYGGILLDVRIPADLVNAKADEFGATGGPVLVTNVSVGGELLAKAGLFSFTAHSFHG